MVIVRRRHEPLRDFKLERDDNHFRRAAAGGKFHQNRRGDGVGQIGNELPIAPVARLALQKFQRVVVMQFQLRVGLVGKLRGVSFLQKIHEPSVQFDGENLAAFFQKQFRQWPKSRPDLQNFVGGREFGGIGDTFQLVRIVQKILSERLGKLDVALGQQLAHFGEFH